ncbi:MAG TPA: cupin domain-containing protein [Steroidobacteraceae bacterium]|nr:cupin domain-containing protein [Steroidobacteraceae bacterium]
MSSVIVRLEGAVSEEMSEPPAERLLAGNPALTVRNFFTDTTQQFFAGRWSATRGKWRVRYTENELCVMTAGRVIIESVNGERSSFAAGDAFVVPAGFSGSWEVVEDCEKIYAIFEAHS